MAVDHNERRRKIADLCVKIIAKEGIDATTVRRIADELGYSTTVVTYYFANKSELMLWTYQSLHEETYGKVQALYDSDPSDVAGCLLSMTAADEVSFDRWRTYVAFWDRASHEPHWAIRQRQDLEEAIEWIGRFVRARNGEQANVPEISRVLNTFIQGLSVQALMDRDSWSKELILAEIGRVLSLVLEAPASVRECG